MFFIEFVDLTRHFPPIVCINLILANSSPPVSSPIWQQPTRQGNDYHMLPSTSTAHVVSWAEVTTAIYSLYIIYYPLLFCMHECTNDHDWQVYLWLTGVKHIPPLPPREHGHGWLWHQWNSKIAILGHHLRPQGSSMTKVSLKTACFKILIASLLASDCCCFTLLRTG